MATITETIPENVMAVLATTARHHGTTLDAQVELWYAAQARVRDASANEQFLESVRRTRQALAAAGITLEEGESVRLIREGRT